MVEEKKRGILRELLPHFLWAIIEKIWDHIFEIVGGIVIASGVGVAAWLRSHLDIITLTTTFVLSSLVLLAMNKRGYYRGEDGRSVEPLPQIAQQPGKLTISIRKGLIGTYIPDSEWPMPENLVLLKIRVSGNTAPDVTIKEWKLNLHSAEDGIPNFQPVTADAIAPIAATYTVKDGTVYGVGNFLDLQTRVHPVRHGIATEGWIIFSSYYEPHILFGKVFEIIAIDDMGGESHQVKYPGDWLEPVKFENKIATQPVLMPPPMMPAPRSPE